MPEWIKNLFSSPGSLELILICLYVGIIAACGAMLYDRRTLGGFVRALIAAGALDKDHAKTLGELGYEKSFSIKRALRGKSVFADTVYEASETLEFDRPDHALPVYRERYDPASARFYIPEVLKYRAEVRFEHKGTHIMALVVAALIFGALLVAILLFKDRIVEAVRSWFEMMS